MSDDMAVAHAKNYAAKNRMRDLRLALLDFMDAPPDSLWPATEAKIHELVNRLQDQEDHIVVVWN